jgi:hypothetical protein
MVDMDMWASNIPFSFPHWNMTTADWLMIAETGALTLATVVLAVFTAGLYFQTKRANRPHISVSLEHASEVGACVLSIENHGPGVAFQIEVKIDEVYCSSDKTVLSPDDPNLIIPFLKPGKARNIRIPGMEKLEPKVNRAQVKYRDVFGGKMDGNFELRTSILMAYDPIFKSSHMWEHYVNNAISAITEPLNALPKEIEELRGEIEHASRNFRSRD